MTKMICFTCAFFLGLLSQQGEALNVHYFGLSRGLGYPENTLDVTLDQVHFLTFNFTFSKKEESLLNTIIYKDGEKVFELDSLFLTPEVLDPFSNSDLTFTSLSVGHASILIHRPRIIHQGFYKLSVKAIKDRSETIFTQEKFIRIEAISNCTELTGRALLKDPCLMHVEYACKYPVYPLSSLRLMAFFGSSLNRLFAIPIGGESIQTEELPDGRFAIKINHTREENNQIPETFFAQVDFYQHNQLLKSDIKDFEKRDQCNKVGTSNPNAILQLSPHTLFPLETPVYFETSTTPMDNWTSSLASSGTSPSTLDPWSLLDSGVSQVGYASITVCLIVSIALTIISGLI